MDSAVEVLADHVSGLMMRAALQAQRWRSLLHGYFAADGNLVDLAVALARVHSTLPGSAAVGGLTAEVVDVEEWDPFAEWETRDLSDEAVEAEILFRRYWGVVLMLRRAPDCDGHQLSPNADEVAAGLVEYTQAGAAAKVGAEMSLVLAGDVVELSRHVAERWAGIDDTQAVCEPTSLRYLLQLEWAELPVMISSFTHPEVADYRALVWWREAGLGTADIFDFAVLNRMKGSPERSAVSSALRRRYGAGSGEQVLAL